jgi:integrative and conjugative element protein (TIGR02256 family)
MSGVFGMKTRYDMESGLYVEFSAAVVETFLTHRQERSQNEAGGILLGRVYAESHVVLEVATMPNALDYAGPYYFNRSRQAAQEVVNRVWRDSNGERNYLGEWHSHPIARPTPSSRDRQMIRNMFRQSVMSVGFLFLVVVGTKENWVGLENGSVLKKLKALK